MPNNENDASPQSTKSENVSQNDIIKIGILSVPRDQVFPIVIVFVLLVSGLGMVIAVTGPFQLSGLIVLVTGIGWAVLIYQSVQNKLKSNEQDFSKSYRITITLLSEHGQPLPGVAVTVVGPVIVRDKKTDKNGRVIYSYTGRDANSYLNREVTITAIHSGLSVRAERPLLRQDNQFVDIELSSKPQSSGEIHKNQEKQIQTPTPGSVVQNNTGNKYLFLLGLVALGVLSMVYLLSIDANSYPAGAGLGVSVIFMFVTLAQR